MGSRKRQRNRLGQCDVCRFVDALYTCPRCEAVTCSLVCVKKHKKDLDCDGVRVRTKYVPVDKMTEHTLLSDYRLLEDVRRCVDEVEWQRETLEGPRQVVPDSTLENIAKVRTGSSANKPLSSTPECSISQSESNHNEDSSNPDNSKKRKRKPKKSGPPESKSDMLIAKAQRIRHEILCKQGNVIDKLKAYKNDAVLNNGRLNCDKENGVENTMTSVTEAPSVAISGISEVTSEDIQLVSSSDKETIVEDPSVIMQIALQESERMPNTDSIRGKIKHPISKEELTRQKKAQMMQAVTLGGRKKAQAMEGLTKAAYTRGISMSCLPEKFEKHWENTSFYLMNEDCIYWHLKVSFINANFYTLSLNECSETMTLANMVKGCIRRSEKYWKEQDKEDPLLVYRITDFSKIHVLMAADKLPNNQRKFYVLDMEKSLRENFVGKCIVEFPQLCVALEDCYVVSAIQEKFVHNFFGETRLANGNGQEDSMNEFESDLKANGINKKKKNTKGKNLTRNELSDRESGELTDSSSADSDFSDTDSHEDSEEELFKESEFRSVYRDLLSTFDADVNQLSYGQSCKENNK